MQLTKHAQFRMQQRAISESVLDLLYAYGREIEQGKAGTLVYFDKCARDRIKKDTPRKTFARIEPKLNAYAVEDDDGAIVTVGYRYKPVRV
ncbi:hypothetical protein G3480_25770 [Thiorhodococcus mannitoliphagus]|uniref:DUF4258 domain-containing protein n=1 Tax=Thiorhodococcus mannitoliphagus TaxID=329406 RepID=A0A6P1E2R4_9GAMM|nr:DUF4258 domain-containing protein [Thiorhodococcus mannitoliphagus]NEX23641.1 hypothetical protein [Thiorhodococcus mannitoliphagus]